MRFQFNFPFFCKIKFYYIMWSVQKTKSPIQKVPETFRIYYCLCVVISASVLKLCWAFIHMNYFNILCGVHWIWKIYLTRFYKGMWILFHTSSLYHNCQKFISVAVCLFKKAIITETVFLNNCILNFVIFTDLFYRIRR